MSYIGASPTSAAFLTNSFSGDGTTTSFTLTVAPASSSSILVAVSGVLQDPATYAVVGTSLNFTGAPPSGTANIIVRFLGIPASNVATASYRTVTEFTATAGQTTFSVPSYTVGFIDVYRNGVMLGSADYTASNGVSVVLASGATAGDLVEVISFQVSSVLNAIPASPSSVGTTNLVDGAVTPAKLSTGGPTWNSSGSVGVGTSIVGTAVLDIANSNDLEEIYFRGTPFTSVKTASTAGMGFSTVQSVPLTFSTADTERMRIDSAGRVTTPFQPAFSARRDAGHVGGSSGNSVIVVFDNVLLNTGSNYNNSNGRFTAPVAGTYYFSSLGMQTGSGSVADAQLRLNKNGTSWAISNPPMGTSQNDGMGFAVSAVIQLNVGDYVQVEWYNSSTWTLYANGGPWNNFSGFLLG